MDRIKILQVITLSEWGGAQAVLYDLAVFLDKKKFLIEVACQGGGPLVKRLRERDIRVREIPSFCREISLWRDFKTFIALYRLIKKEKYDIVHCHSTKAGFLGRLATKLAGVKKVYFTAHGWSFYNKEEFGGLKKWFVLLEKIAARFSTKIVCVSEKTKEDALKLKIAPESKFLVINNGINFLPPKKPSKAARGRITAIAETFRQRKKLGLGKKETVIGMVGRLAYPKDPLLFFEAAKEIKNNFPKTKFILVGDGPLTGDCREFVKKNNLERDILLLGARGPEETRKILLALDIFVLVSKFEGLPITIIEAMFAGLPVVASDVGGVREMIRQGFNGFLIKKSSLEELKEKIVYLIKNPSKRKIMGRRGLLLAKKKFGLEKMLDAYERLYQSA